MTTLSEDTILAAARSARLGKLARDAIVLRRRLGSWPWNALRGTGGEWPEAWIAEVRAELARAGFLRVNRDWAPKAIRAAASVGEAVGQ